VRTRRPAGEVTQRPARAVVRGHQARPLIVMVSVSARRLRVARVGEFDRALGRHRPHSPPRWLSGWRRWANASPARVRSEDESPGDALGSVPVRRPSDRSRPAPAAGAVGGRHRVSPLPRRSSDRLSPGQGAGEGNGEVLVRAAALEGHGRPVGSVTDTRRPGRHSGTEAGRPAASRRQKPFGVWESPTTSPAGLVTRER
jgi:hypothetical protein